MKAVIILSNDDVCLLPLRIPVRTRQGFHLLLSQSPSLLGFLTVGKWQRVDCRSYTVTTFSNVSLLTTVKNQPRQQEPMGLFHTYGAACLLKAHQSWDLAFVHEQLTNERESCLHVTLSFWGGRLCLCLLLMHQTAAKVTRPSWSLWVVAWRGCHLGSPKFYLDILTLTWTNLEGYDWKERLTWSEIWSSHG